MDTKWKHEFPLIQLEETNGKKERNSLYSWLSGFYMYVYMLNIESVVFRWI